MVVQMRKPKISFIRGLQAQNNIDLCRCLKYTAEKQQLQTPTCPRGFIYGGVKRA